MAERWEDFLALMKLAPGGNGALTSLKKQGYPWEVEAAAARRFRRLLERHAKQGKPPLTPWQVESLVGKITDKVCRDIMGVLADLAPELNAARAQRLLGLPPRTQAFWLPKRANAPHGCGGSPADIRALSPHTPPGKDTAFPGGDPFIQFVA